MYFNQKKKNGRWKFLEVMDMFMALIVVMVALVYPYLQTLQVVHI